MKFWVMVAVGASLIAGAANAAPNYGDADGNGTVDVNDVRVIMRVAGGLQPLTDTIRRNADVAPVNNYDRGSFGDGKITFLDAARVYREVRGLAEPDFPAKENFYLLEVGNSFTLRKYNASGPTTGPGTANPDVVATITRTQQDTVSTGTYTVYVVNTTDGKEEHLTTEYIPASGRPAISVTQGTISGSQAPFDPPLVVLEYPVQNGTTWGPYTTSTSISGVAVTATYTGTVSGPVSVTTPAQTFDNAYKVTIAYTAPTFLGNITGEEYYWFVPYLGPVQHGYTRTAPFVGTSTVNPDLALVSANIHGVTYP